MGLLYLCSNSRLRIIKNRKNKNLHRNLLTVDETEEKVLTAIPDIGNLKQTIRDQIKEATKQAEKKTAHKRQEVTARKHDGFINVNAFLGGLLLFGLTGRRPGDNLPERAVLELQVMSFFIFLGAIMSTLMFLLFVKFYSWKKYEPYQNALGKIKSKAERMSLTNQNVSSYDDECREAEQIYENRKNHTESCSDWKTYQQYQSLVQVNRKEVSENISPSLETQHNDIILEFAQWTKDVIDTAAQEESRDREKMRRWSIVFPFSLTCMGMIMLCLVVLKGAHVQLRPGRQHKEGGLQLWIYILAPSFLIIPFLLTLRLTWFYTGRLYDMY